MLNPFGPYRPDNDDDDWEWEPRMQWCFGPRPWGMFFRGLPCLETFTMDFDATEDRREAMGELVERAVREWRFPLGDDGPFMYLSAEGSPVEKTSWRGPLVINDWGITRLFCYPCDSFVTPEDGVGEAAMDEARVRATCPLCYTRMLLREKMYGDRMYT